MKSNINRVAPLNVPSRILGAIVILFGALPILGWAINNEVLKSIFPGLVAMNPATASAFILGGLSTLLFNKEKSSFASALGKIFALAVTLIGFFRIFGYLTPWDIKIDQILFHHKLGTNVMAPNTAWNFLLIGLSLLVLDVKNRFIFWINQTFIIIALLTSFLAIIGYAYSVQALYNVRSYIPMALNTAIAFALLVASILCLRPQRGLMAVFVSDYAGGDLARRLLPATILIPTALGALRLLGENQGFYGTAFGVALLTVSNIVVFAVLIWWTANIINQSDKARRNAEEDLLKAHDKLEIRVDERTKELKEAQHQLVQQERLRALGEMASGIAHDFNNTLVPILGYSELMLEGNNFDDKKTITEQLKTMNTAAKDASKIVSRLREFGRPRNENDPLSMIDLNHLVTQVVSLTHPKWKAQAMSQGVDITIETHLGEIPSIEGNEQELREVLTNLIFNAVDAMSKSGAIQLSTHIENEHVVLEVSDTGMGMSEEVRRRCLEPFFSTKGERGTGLGLSMVYGIIQRHKGTIDIQSELGKGTTFSVHFPVGKNDKNEGETEEKKSGVKGLHILYVEDEPQVRNVIVNYLKCDGHIVQTASNGSEGLRMFYEGKDKFDLVITDHAMPQMSGEQLSFAIKKLDPKKPIILLSGTFDFAKIPSTVDEALMKPVTIDDLRQAIRNVFKISEKQ